MNHDDYYNGYVLGFLFSDDLKKVILIRKNRPANQIGLLNGVGGKIEYGESCFSAIVREFQEETGVLIENWSFLKTLKFDVNVHVFYSVGDTKRCFPQTDEEIWSMPVFKVATRPWNPIKISGPSVQLVEKHGNITRPGEENSFELNLFKDVSVLVDECLGQIYSKRHPVYNAQDDIANYKPIIKQTEN
jgi:8-oxo-dGTP pyrophosphatase MutT (NUDIX family)